MAGKRNSPEPPNKEFRRIIRGLSTRQTRSRVFSDFCELGAMALSNTVCREPKREERYLEVVKRYSREEAVSLSRLLACVVRGLDWNTDFLGQQFKELELGNRQEGQFFTSMEVARLMATMIVDQSTLARTIQEQGAYTLLEPAAGSGATILAFAAAMARAGFDPRQHLHVTAIDNNPTVAYMCFIQLAVLDIPAVVYVGDTLRMQMREELHTPAHYRLSRARGAR